MWIWLSATAKPHASPATIGAKRHQWIEQGKDRQLAARCRWAQRYVVQGADPPRVLWLLDTDDSEAATLITEHFGDLWEITVDRVVPQAIGPSAA